MASENRSFQMTYTYYVEAIRSIQKHLGELQLNDSKTQDLRGETILKNGMTLLWKDEILDMRASRMDMTMIYYYEGLPLNKP